MPSSLIFAALAAAWLVVLVPMVAKRRQEVVRITESALASRVLNRQATYRPAFRHDQEVPQMGEAEWESTPDERRYRPGRGGYDPEAAELAARERYAFRQQVVLGLLVGAVATVVLGFAVSNLFWWIHAALDAALVGYLGYLRRQVRIEQELRNRRAARMSGSRGSVAPPAPPSPEEEPDAEHAGELRYEESRYEESQYEEATDVVGSPVRRPPWRPPAAHPTAVALDLDDDDPMFDELDPTFQPPYRRAAGE
ncbi:MAG: divisome protein SepX/GlpR [Pseudonocardiaceae bacterium]